jgi:hypothetical protein
MLYGKLDLFDQPKHPLLSPQAAMERKNKEREEIEQLTALFLMKGGTISRHEPQERQPDKRFGEK